MEQASTRALPALGSKFKGGKYAGVTTTKDGEAYALILQAGTTERLNWSDSVAWAKAKRGLLPNRVESLMLFTNLPEQFGKKIYWTREEASFYDAWVQGFSNGNHSPNRKSSLYCSARCVRRFPLNPSVL